jgi:hypothetical protein
MFALPLFLPLFIYLGNYATTADLEGSMRTLGREAGRGFVLSENDDIAYDVAEEIFAKGARILGYEELIENRELTLSIQCENSPCISPKNEITLNVFSKKLNRTITTVVYTSAWS